MKLLTTLLLLFSLTIQAANVQVPVYNIVSGQIANRRITLTLLQPGVTTAGPWILAGDAFSLFTDATGNVTFTNVLAGGYRLDVAGTPSRSFPIGVPDTNITINVVSLINATNTTPYYYNASQIQTGAWVTNSGTDGQVPVKSGDSFKFSTAAGSGDVTQSGQNNFTGSNSFSGKINSSGSNTFTGTNFFSDKATFNNTNSIFAGAAAKATVTSSAAQALLGVDGSYNLTITSIAELILGTYVGAQLGSANLTNWSALSTNLLGGSQTNIALIGVTNANNLTNWSTLSTNAFVNSGGGNGTNITLEVMKVNRGSTNLFSVGTNLNSGSSEQIVRTYGAGRQIGQQTPSRTSETPNRTFSDSYFRHLGGSGAALDYLPLKGPEIWKRKPLPPVIYTTAFLVSDTTTFGSSQNFVTNAVAMLRTNLQPWLNLNNVPITISLEAWAYTNSTISLNRDANGNMWWATNMFADGMPFIANYMHTNNMELELLVAYDTVRSGTSVYENGPQGFRVITTPDEVNMDVFQLYAWGVNSIRVGDVSQAGYYRQMCRQWADAVMAPNSIPIRETTNGLIVAGGITQFSNQMWLELTATAPPIHPDFPFSGNTMITDQPYSTANPVAITNYMYQARVTYTNFAPYIGKGHYMSGQLIDDGTGDTSLADARAMFTMGAMFCATIQLGYHTNITASLVPNFMQAFTNNDMRKIYFDDAQMPAVRIYDLGPSNISCWVKPLESGDYAVALVNESGASLSVGFAFSQITSDGSYYPPIGATIPRFKLDTNAVCALYDVWGQSMTGETQQTATQTVASHSVFLGRLTPISILKPIAAGTVATTNDFRIYGSLATMNIFARDNPAQGMSFWSSSSVGHLLAINGQTAIADFMETTPFRWTNLTPVVATSSFDVRGQLLSVNQTNTGNIETATLDTTGAATIGGTLSVGGTPGSTIAGLLTVSNLFSTNIVRATNGFISQVKAAFSTNYTVQVSDEFLFCMGTNQIITLLNATNAATLAGKKFMIVAATTTGSVIVTNANGVQTVLGGLSISVPSTNRLAVVSDGGNWW